MIVRFPTPPEETPESLGSDDIADLVQVFKLLGDETRLRIVLHVNRHGTANVTELCGLLGLPQPLVSHHLAVLRSAGILDSKRAGKEQHYHVCPGRFERLMDMLVDRQRCLRPCDRFLECVFG